MSKLGMAFASSGGDAKLQMAVIEGIARVGWKRVNSVFINSVLSGPLTHARNLGGNAVAIGERVFSRAIGGEGFTSFRAFDGFAETISESLSLAKQSFGSPYSVVTDSSKVVDYALQDRRVIENAINAAKTPGEKAATASTALQLFDFTNQPWFSWPGRALQAGDDLTKSILARMELRFQAAKEAADYAKTLKPGEQLKSADEFYRALKDSKLSPSGKILDHDLLDITEAAAFNALSKGGRRLWAAPSKEHPVGGSSCPSTKPDTTSSLCSAGVSTCPLSKEFREVMEFGTETQKAVMRGRMATSYLVVSSAAGLAAADLLTGYGPPPGEERDDWLKSHEPNSIRIGDKWVSYQAVPGIALVMSTVADITNMTGR